MFNITIIIISILSGFSLFVPVFSGYFLALLMLFIGGVAKFLPGSPVEIGCKYQFQQRLRGVSRALLLFAALCGLSCAASFGMGGYDGKDLLRGYLHFLAKNLVLWFSYWSFYWRFSIEGKDRQNFSWSFAVFSLVNLFYCIAQRSFGFDWLHGFSAVLPENRLSNGVYRVSGFMGHPLSLGYCQALACVATLGLGFDCRHRWEKFAWCVGAVSALIVVMISGSRGPQLVLLIGLLTLFPLPVVAKNWKISVAVVLTLLLLSVNFGFFARFYELSSANLGGDMRMTHWTVYWRVFMDHFLFGIGPGGQEAAISAYYLSVGASDNIKIAHNAFLQYGAEYGAIGLVGLAAVVFAWFKLALGLVLVRRSMFAVILVTLLGACTQNNLQDSEYVLSFTVWLMLLVTLEVEAGESSKARRTKTQNSLTREGVEVT
jgi:hypothetical protein